MNKWECILAIICSLAAVDVSADSIKCEKGFVSTGDVKVELINKCGEPIDKMQLDDTSGGRKGFSTNRIEKWTYVTDGFIRVVNMINGRVSTIETAGRAEQ